MSPEKAVCCPFAIHNNMHCFHVPTHYRLNFSEIRISTQHTPLGLLPGNGLQVLFFVPIPLLVVDAIGSFCGRLMGAAISIPYVVLLAQRLE